MQLPLHSRPFESILLHRNWTFASAETRIFRPVSQFPTNIHLDLLSHSLIPDAFIGENEKLVQWVGDTSWVYRTIFSLPSVVSLRGLGMSSKAVLNFDGLDTLATVYLNGEEVLKTENMFIPERVEVSKLLKTEGNVLEIKFESAFQRGAQVVENSPDHIWACWNGDAGRLAVRKAQYHWVSVLVDIPSSLPNRCTSCRAGTGAQSL